MTTTSTTNTNKTSTAAKDDTKDNSEDGGIVADELCNYTYSPTISVSVFIFWIVPVLLIAIMSRYFVEVDTSPKPIFKDTKSDTSKFINVDLNAEPGSRPSSSSSRRTSDTTGTKSAAVDTKMKMKMKSSSPSPGSSPSPVPTLYSNGPTSYKSIVDSINQRRRVLASTTVSSSTSASTTSSSSRSSSQQETKKDRNKESERGSTDPVRVNLNKEIIRLREEYEEDEQNVYKVIALADALLQYDLDYLDGGTKQPEALKMYEHAIQLTLKKKEEYQRKGQPTNIHINPTTSSESINIPFEVKLDYKKKSIDGSLCGLYTAKGKVYFRANMFEKAVDSYTKCIQIESLYLEAVSSRGSALIVLGRYDEAGYDFLTVIQGKNVYMFTVAFTELARVLATKEDAIAGGWEIPIAKLNQIMPKAEGKLSSISNYDNQQQENIKIMLHSILNRLHHVMFTYHDVKTKNISLAWEHLTKSYKYKMLSLPKWEPGYFKSKVVQVMNVFKRGFWPDNVGSTSKVPIFIIGFARSGSTLLERILDSHPLIVGTGENSIFSARVDEIRNAIVERRLTMDNDLLLSTIAELAEGVVDEMKQRWKLIDRNTKKDESTPSSLETQQDPQRFVDKNLHNFFSVGLIHLLFPNALILHVFRNPMDTCFSAYKHEFSSRALDYTSDFNGLAELYSSYRDLMDHWDKELPGRVTHIKYEDMVYDMEGVARAIINATGLEWHNDILNFHKKKHTVNTFSTTQVRKGIYTHSIDSYKKYEEQLQPLIDLLDHRVQYNNIRTNLPGYKPPSTTISPEEKTINSIKSGEL